ncbi:hypothetical protein H257_18093 [Aphanomyces astaci]|uniref:Uncharacterized protein n=1 Tax=Aphanomyces astaci TaxID=112090 RepID=W4FEG8_APHAT|nr:hypothetical protein H257_18093 [Aphanomyces astaci]ETV65103.1 hypothetical protein H257_18093 [Aphanomyces astaci]|eukprot:XP_009845406.1 hypothetical protein H257_18093 [Aphanomyces astaci]
MISNKKKATKEDKCKILDSASQTVTPCESANAIMSFTSIMETTNKFNVDELAFQKESNAIAMRTLELDEKCYLLDKAEGEASFALR